MGHTVGCEVRAFIGWMRQHPLLTVLALGVLVMSLTSTWITVRSQFIDLDDYVVVSAAGRAELPESVGGAFALQLQNGERVHPACQVWRPRSYARQTCVEEAYRAGLRDGELVTVVYLRPPREGWDRPLLLSIRGAERSYMSCPDRLAALGLRAARYRPLCSRRSGSAGDRGRGTRPQAENSLGETIRPSPD